MSWSWVLYFYTTDDYVEMNSSWEDWVPSTVSSRSTFSSVYIKQWNLMRPCRGLLNRYKIRHCFNWVKKPNRFLKKFHTHFLLCITYSPSVNNNSTIFTNTALSCNFINLLFSTWTSLAVDLRNTFGWIFGWHCIVVTVVGCPKEVCLQ